MSRQRPKPPVNARPRVWVILLGSVGVLVATVGFFVLSHRPRADRHPFPTTSAPAATGLEALAQQSSAAIAARGRQPADVPLHRKYVAALKSAGRFDDVTTFVRDWLRDQPHDVEFLDLGARSAERSGDHDATSALLRRLAALDPDPEIRMRLAQVQIRAARRPVARRTLAALLDDHPAHFGARSLLVDLDFAAENFEAAAPALDWLLEARPDDLGLRAKAARCLVELGEYEETVATHNAAAGRSDAPAELCFNVGLALLRLGRHQEGADRLADALTRNPYHAQAYSQLAQASRRLNRPAAATMFADSFGLVDPLADERRRAAQAEAAGYLADAAQRQAAISMQTGRYQLAGEQLLRALELGPDQPAMVDRVARYWRVVHRPDRAEQTIRRALDRQLEPRAAFLTRLGQSLVEQKRPTDAERAYRQALEADAKYAEAALGLAEILVETHQDPDAALALLAPFESEATRDWRVSYWRGRAALLGDQSDLASRHLAQAVQLSQKKEASPLCWLGIAVSRLGRHQQAGPLLVGAQQLDGSDPEPFRGLVEVFTRLGDAPRADQARQRLAELERQQQRHDELLGVLWSSTGTATAGAYSALGKQYLAAGRGADAQTCLMLAWQIDPQLVEARRLVAEHMTTPKDYFMRAFILEQGLTHAPNDAWFAITLARHYATAGLKLGRCRQLIDQALRTEPTAANHAAAAEVLSRFGQHADALAHAQQATELDPTSAPFKAILEKLRTGPTTTQPKP